MNYSTAKEKAEYFLNRVQPSCLRAEIVGSVKRGTNIYNYDKQVHDIEILLIPKPGHPAPTFGKPQEAYASHFEKALADMEGEGLLKHAVNNPRNGPALKKRAIVGVGGINEFCIEFWIVRPETWAIQNVIRTGPALFSHRFVTNKNKQAFDPETKLLWPGFLPNEYEYIRGETIIRKRKGGTVIDLKEEADAIGLLGVGWIAPGARERWAVR